MSKFKNGDKVVVKSNGKVGVIKGREIKQLPNSNRVKIEYVVKTGEGFENWNAYDKRDIERVKTTRRNREVPMIVVDTDKGYKVTLVGLVTNKIIWKDRIDENGFYDTYKRNGKELSIGYAIYNPNDEYDLNFGKKIAIHRAKKRPFCQIDSEFSGEFNKETVDSLLKVKGEYIAKNIEKYISK